MRVLRPVTQSPIQASKIPTGSDWLDKDDQTGVENLWTPWKMFYKW